MRGFVLVRQRVYEFGRYTGGLKAPANRWFQAKCKQAASLIASNQGSFAAMKSRAALSIADLAADAVTVVRSNGFLTLAALMGAGAVGVFAVLASGSSEPVVLTLMAVLSTIGIFFVLAALAGHIRLSGRVTAQEFAIGAADAIDDGIQISGRGGEAFFTSRVFQTFLGVTTAGTARTLEEVLAVEPGASQALFRLTRAAERGQARVETFSLTRPQAGLHWYRLSVKPWSDGAARAGLGWLSVWHLSDVTSNLQRDEERSAALRDKLQLYDRMPVGLMVVDDTGAVEHLNARLGDWLAMSPASRNRAMRLSDLVSGDTADLLRMLARRQSGAVQPIDIDLVGQQGHSVAVRLIVMERESSSASGAGFVAAVVKRTAESSGLANLKSPGTRLTRLFDTAPFGIALIAADGRISSANASFNRLLFTNGPVEGVMAVSLLGREAVGGLRAPIEAAIAAVLAQKAGVAPVEVTVGEAGEFTRRIIMSPLGTSAGIGGADVAVLYVMDATEQKTLEVNFAQSQKMEAVGKLAGGIAHDFNNVLTAIIGFSDLLLQTHRPSDPAHKNITAIKSSANRAAGMVSQLLAFSRRQTLQPEVLQLGETLGDLSVLLNRLLGEKIDLKILQGRDLWFVKADRSQLSQVFINLAVNARDAMLDGGSLRISTRNLSERESQKIEQPGFVVGEYVVIDVEDTGHGMKPEVMAKIFEPFFTTKGIGKGTGLGLSTVYGIVKQTGGFIFPESSPRGTTFRVYLPRHHVDNIEEIIHQKVAKKDRATDLTGTGRVLLVEDEDAVRGFAVEALKRQGYEVLQAASGVEALEVIAATDKPIDLVVSDVIMPEMDGPTLLKELRRTRPDLKFIFMSGYPDDAFKNTLDADTEFAFLQKPFSLVQLASKVKEQISR